MTAMPWRGFFVATAWFTIRAQRQARSRWRKEKIEPRGRFSRLFLPTFGKLLKFALAM